MARGLTGRAFAIVGAASYGIYILQEPLYGLTHQFGNIVLTHCSRGVRVLFGIVVVVAIFVLALVADKHYDRPARAALARYLMRKPHEIRGGSLKELIARKIEGV